MVGEDNIADHGEELKDGKVNRVAKDYFLEYFKSKATRYDQTRNNKKVSVHTGICLFCPEEKLVRAQSGYSNFQQHIESQHQDMLEGHSRVPEGDNECNSDEIQVEGEEDEDEADGSEEDMRRLWTAKLDVVVLQITIEENVYTIGPSLRNRIWQKVAKRLQETTGDGEYSARNCHKRVEQLLHHFNSGHPKLSERLDIETNSTRRELLEELSKIKEESGVNVAGESEESAVRASVKVNKTRRFRPYLTDKQSLASTRTRRAHSSVQCPHLGYELPEGNDGPNETENGVHEYLTTFSGEANSETDGTHEGYHATAHHGHDEDRTWAKEHMESRRAEDLRRREEIALHREELQMQRLRLDLEKLRWETEKKEREARLAMEIQERKLLFDFMRKTLSLEQPATHPEPAVQ
ncbi:hypothetical protein RvY_16570 [Ramazzottius varieornatus]|uniref:Myb-like domain-containing protein n=1 Tax=Ramazzottius varieornatus TaxID=947166 RepID=A0A1D1W392_RAMVA|nr:hypothetical protein RvY_16570 [Ramazzottius varieornatus]